MSLDDPTKKMSKSNPNPQSRVELLDSPDEIRKKFSRAVTDSDRAVRFDPADKAAVSNLLVIYSLTTGQTIDDICTEYDGKGYGDFKKGLAEAVVSHLQPIQARYRDIRSSGEVQRVLHEGSLRAATVAERTMKRVRERVGLGSGSRG
jgi:tryptophanyl-tRNA synthetase